MNGLLLPHWVKERMALLRELLATPDMNEDEREQSMADLIRIQRGRRER